MASQPMLEDCYNCDDPYASGPNLPVQRLAVKSQNPSPAKRNRADAMQVSPPCFLILHGRKEIVQIVLFLVLSLVPQFTNVVKEATLALFAQVSFGIDGIFF
jgi:hypothetical protein